MCSARSVNGAGVSLLLTQQRRFACNGVMQLVLVIAVLSGVAVAQGVEVPSTGLATKRLAEVVGGEQHVSQVPDGSAVAVVDHDKWVARIVDAKTGDVTESVHMGKVSAIALLPNNRGYWLGLTDGAVVHVPRGGKERVFKVVDNKLVDGLQCVGGNVAWSSSIANRGGVLDARDGSERFATACPFGGFRLPRMFLSRDARHVVHYAKDPASGGRRMLILRDAMTGKQLGSANSYVSHRKRSHAFGLDGVLTVARKDRAWHLHRLDLVDLQNHVIDDDVRGKHFVDLFISPSAHYLLEGDFEDDGAVLYHLADGGAHKSLLGKKAWPVGFLGAGDWGEELALTSGETSRLGLRAWSTKTGELFAELPCGKGKRITQAGSLLGGKAMWFQWWPAPKGATIGRHLRVVAFGR